MKFVAAQARRNISIQFVNKDYSKYATFPVFASYFLDILHIDTAVKDVLKVKSKNFSFSETEYLLFLFTIIFLGISHVYKADDLLAEEEQLAKVLGFRKGVFPSSKSLYRILSQADHWSVKRLDNVNGLLLKQRKDDLSKKRWLVADIDQTKKLTEGITIEKAKPCYSSERKGMLGLRLSAGVVEGLVFAQKLEPGNVGNAEAFAEILDTTLQKLDRMSAILRSRRVKLKKVILRIDGGYFAKQTFEKLEKVRKLRKLDFIMRIHSGLPLIEEAKKQATKRDTKTDHFVKIAEHIAVLRLPNQQVLADWKTPYTVLIIREKRKKIISKKKRISHKTVTLEYPLVTTLSHWHTKKIITFYKKRQTIEDIFKDFNQSFHAETLPSHTFYGNALYFQMVSLIANSAFFFQNGYAQYSLSNSNSRNDTG